MGLSSVAAIVVGVRLNEPAAARAWYLVALGQLLFVAGAAVALVYSLLHRETPDPSTGDVLHVAAYPAIGAGLLLMLRARSPGRDVAYLIDAAIATTGIALFSWIFLIEPYMDGDTLTGHGNLLPALYPLLDLALAAVAARILIGAGFRVVSYSLLGCALLLRLAGDGVYLLSTTQGWGGGTGLELLWLAAYVAWGLAALEPSMAKITERGFGEEEELTRERLAALALVTLAIPLLMLEQSIRTSDLNILLMVMASTALFGLVIARLAGVVTRHDRAKQREACLREAAASLVATRNRAGIYRIAVDTALALSEADGATATRTTLSLGGPTEMTVVDASGARTEGLVGRHVENVPAPLREALLAGRVGSFSGPAEIGAADSLPVSA